MYTVVQSWHESLQTSWPALYLSIESLAWVSDFPRVFVEANATRIPSGLCVLLIAAEIFGTSGMQRVGTGLLHVLAKNLFTEFHDVAL